MEMVVKAHRTSSSMCLEIAHDCDWNILKVKNKLLPDTVLYFSGFFRPEGPVRWCSNWTDSKTMPMAHGFWSWPVAKMAMEPSKRLFISSSSSGSNIIIIIIIIMMFIIIIIIMMFIITNTIIDINNLIIIEVIVTVVTNITTTTIIIIIIITNTIIDINNLIIIEVIVTVVTNITTTIIIIIIIMMFIITNTIIDINNLIIIEVIVTIITTTIITNTIIITTTIITNTIIIIIIIMMFIIANTIININNLIIIEVIVTVVTIITTTIITTIIIIIIIIRSTSKILWFAVDLSASMMRLLLSQPGLLSLDTYMHIYHAHPYKNFQATCGKVAVSFLSGTGAPYSALNPRSLQGLCQIIWSWFRHSACMCFDGRDNISPNDKRSYIYIYIYVHNCISIYIYTFITLAQKCLIELLMWNASNVHKQSS